MSRHTDGLSSEAEFESSTARPELAVKTIDDLEQLRALSDPLRLRILEALCGPPRTTKQVADRLGEKPTRLYHHVDALEAAGLIRLLHTRPKRGTLEKYYQSVARQFRTDPSIFPRSGEGPSDDSWQLLGAQLLEGAAVDLRRLAAATEQNEVEADPERFEAMIARIKVHASPSSLTSIYEKLEALLTELSDEDPGEPDESCRSFDLVLAFFPEPESES
ncbi:MAG: helix-turn-helix domain-containing protein [Thermoanaerobaculia bacterium]|nr:helix-turn-helix domain-containing protein [Thermoanaerobaculia bacterium]